MAATKDLNDAIIFFETRSTKMKPKEVNNIDEENNTVKKTGAELLSVDVYDEKILLNRKQVFVGQKCASLMKSLDLTPLSCQLDDFYGRVFKFHQLSVSKLQTYFETGLSSLELEWMASLSPQSRTKANTPDQIMNLAHSFSKIVDGIAPGNDMDTLKNEVDLYNIDDNIK